MRIVHLVVVCLGLAACGGNGVHHLADSGTDGSTGSNEPTIKVEPTTATVSVINGAAVTQAYTATLVEPDGSTTDVTSSATFSFADPSYGTWSGATATLTGQGAGPVEVIATADSASGSAQLVVMVQSARAEGSGSGVAGLFGSATEDPGLAPQLVYPTDGILVPPNLGQFDVHWNDDLNNVFEVEMANQYVDITIYTDGLTLGQAAGQGNQPFWTVFQPDEWAPIASSKQTLTLTVSGMSSAAPGTKGTAPAQHVDVTNENAKGGIYYWTTTTQTIMRYDIAQPDTPPAQLYQTNPDGGACIGCHTLSHDGTKIAMTFNGQNGAGGAFDVATGATLIDPTGSDGPVWDWNFASFDGDGSKLVAVLSGQLEILDVTNNGNQLGTIPNGSAWAGQTGLTLYGTMPEVSPDGTMLVNVETPGQDGDIYETQSQIVVRSYNDTTMTFGPESIIVGYDGSNAPNTYSYYPSWSPDGQWIAYTQSTNGSYSYNNSSAETWVVKADGSVPPIRMSSADQVYASGGFQNPTNSWARWVPFGQTFGSNSEPLFYLTFSSERPFGVRIPQGGRPQIWMTPFFPDRAMAGQDPSGPAFRVPFQDVTTANHIAQWTQALVQ
jgi:hypothetical protein